MRSLRPLLACLAISVTIIAACGSPAASGAGGPTATSGGGEATATTPGEPTQPAATTGGGGGGANGSVTYQITGGYSASGELPYVPQVSSFSNAGWLATFAKEGAEELVQINTVGGGLAVVYGDTKAAIAGGADSGCIFNITQNNAGGLAGDFRCSGIMGVINATATQIQVDFSGTFQSHP